MDTARASIQGTRVFAGRRAVRLADMDAGGRVRLDAVARFLQDVAIDDVGETGWGAPEHLWFVRRIRVDVLVPLLADRVVELTTWCSGVATIAAGRRWSVKGDHGGHVEVDSVWIHLDRDGRPARIDGFGPYREAAGASSVSTRFELPDPPAGIAGAAWALRSADVDLHGHVNNAVHWQAVEHALIASGVVDPTLPFRAELDYREPLDLDDAVELVRFDVPDGVALGIVSADAVRAVAVVGSLRPGDGALPFGTRSEAEATPRPS